MNAPKEDFPVLRSNPGLVYLDSACTALKPRQVIEAESSYYTELGACGGRSSHRLGRLTSERAEAARETVAGFVGARPDMLVWTRNTTESLNIVADGLDYSARRKVVVSVMEHHSVLLPFMRLRDRGVIDLEIVGCDGAGETGADEWEKAIDRKTALVVTHSWNNTTGSGHDVRSLSKLAHDNGALLCVDGAQGVPHHRTDAKDADFLCFSGHKMMGPSGIGALVARKERLSALRPLMSGGGTVKTVSLDKIVEMNDQSRFEAGVQHYSGMIGFAAACDYLKRMGMDKIEAHEKELAAELRKALGGAGAEIYGPDGATGHGALYAFNFRGAKPHDVALMLDRDNIAVRSGFFCAQPAMERIGAKDGAVRASGYIYNSVEDVRKFGESLSRIASLYR